MHKWSDRGWTRHPGWTKCSRTKLTKYKLFWANATNVMLSERFSDSWNKLHTHSQNPQKSTQALIKTSESCRQITQLYFCLSLPAPLHARAVRWSCSLPLQSISAGPPHGGPPRPPSPQPKIYPWLLLNLYRMIRLGLHPRTPLSPSRDSAGSIAANA